MQKLEFEKLIGQIVTDEEYKDIERVYMEAPDDWDKEWFCKAFKPAMRNHVTASLFYSMAERLNKKDLRIENLKHDLEMFQAKVDEEKYKAEVAINTNNELKEERDEAISQREALALELLNNGLDEQAIKILGHAYVIRLKCIHNLELSNSDKIYLANNLK